MHMPLGRKGRLALTIAAAVTMPCTTMTGPAHAWVSIPKASRS
ncbi:hypothetical protein [Actinomadura roseirufa]|nr:hypothetical protein [Actinomadura roseirufa]